jgi:Transcriptional activator of acetoin/glycerol metabolism
MAKYTKQQMINALTETKGQITLAARRLGCSYNTIRSYMEKYPEIAETLTEESEKMGDAVELALYDEAVNKRNVAALIFLAKTKFKHRGYVERTEHTGADGKPIQTQQTNVNIAAESAHDASNILKQLAELGAIPPDTSATDNHAETE